MTGREDDGADHDDQFVGHADRGNHAVEREHDIDDEQLHNHGREAAFGIAFFMTRAFDSRVDFLRSLP